jgi:ATP:cob(I)alamin adenosyltransferase
LCTQTGLAGSACTAVNTDIQQALFRLQPTIFEMNGSVRGKNTITENTLIKLKASLNTFKQILPVESPAFVLPRGTGEVAVLHYCRSLSKKVIRALVRIDMEGEKVPAELPRLSNVLVNYYFTLAQVANLRAGVEQPAFHSKNYKIPNNPPG